VTVLLARNRQPPPTVAAVVLHAELAAELITLPSGLLAMVCEAIVTLKVHLAADGVRACVLAAWAIGEGPTRSRRVLSASQSRLRAVLTSRVSRSHGCGVLAVLRVVPYSSGVRCGQTPPRFPAYGPVAS
jgi:hypothetical protein